VSRASSQGTLLALVRLATGSVLLLKPAAAAAALGSPRAASHPVLRSLGARQVLQATVSLRGLGPRGQALGAVVDTTHAASCVVLAWRRPSLRTPALRNAGVAALLAAWGFAR